MKHLEIFEGYTGSKNLRFPSIIQFLSIPADNASAKAAYIKKNSGKGNSMIESDYIVRGIHSLLSEIKEAGLDSRYAGAIGKAMNDLKPALKKWEVSIKDVVPPLEDDDDDNL